jgi:hypothetical protein
MLVIRLFGISMLLVWAGCSSNNNADSANTNNAGTGGKSQNASSTSSSGANTGGASAKSSTSTGGTTTDSNTSAGGTTSGTDTSMGGTTSSSTQAGGTTSKAGTGAGGTTSKASTGSGGTTSKASTGSGGITSKVTTGTGGTTSKASTGTGGTTSKASTSTGGSGDGGNGGTGGTTTASTGPCEYECTDFCLNAGGEVMPGTCSKAGYVCCNVNSKEITVTGKEFYIDNDKGSDNNDGSSPEKAWKSVTKIKSATSGSVVSLKRGSVWQTSGAISVNNLTVRPYGEGPRPVVNGTNIVVPQSLATIVLTGKAVLDAVKVTSDSGFGAYINGDNNEIRNVEVDGSGTAALMGIGILGDNNKVMGCYVHDLTVNTGDTGDVNSSGGAEGIVSFGGDHIEAAYNTVARAHCANKTLGGDEGGCTEIIMNPQFGLTMTDIKYHHNLCVDTVGLFEACQGTGQAGFDPTKNPGTITDVTVAYNVVVDSKWMYLLQIVNTIHKNVVFEHNSIIHGPRNNTQWSTDAMSHYYMWGMMFSASNGTSVSDSLTADQLIVRNNLFTEPYSKENLFIGVTSGHNNNLFSPSTAKLESRWTLAATEKKVDDVGLVDVFNLTATSPAVDKASTEGLYTTDFYGNAPCGSAPDIGAVEYCENAATKGKSDEIARYLELNAK